MNISEQTLVIIKPHVYLANMLESAVESLMTVCRDQGRLRIAGSVLISLPKPAVEEFYAEHRDKSFFCPVVEAGTEGPSYVFILEGNHAIRKMREAIGPTSGDVRGTLRGMYSVGLPRNGFHASDSTESFRRERDIVLKYMAELAGKG